MRNTHRIPALTVSIIAVTLGAAAPATAGPDRGPAVRDRQGGCSLERVGTQLVRCDDLTGGNVEAPTWITERT